MMIRKVNSLIHLNIFDYVGEDYGDSLKSLRLALGVTLKEISDVTHVSYSTMGKLEGYGYKWPKLPMKKIKILLQYYEKHPKAEMLSDKPHVDIEVIREFCADINKGYTWNEISDMSGIARSTLLRFMYTEDVTMHPKHISELYMFYTNTKKLLCGQ